MEPLTQGLLGASLSLSACKKQHLRVAGVLGFLAAMPPDLDVLIRSSNDPLLFLEYHRHFTHSLLFIPFGSLICALLMHPIFAKKRGLSFKQSWLYCALGYGTHGLLDACTSYGTQLLWPLTDERYAWNLISVIDPLFTLPILILIGFSLMKRKYSLARLAIAWALIYLSVGIVQRERAEAAGSKLAYEREHAPVQLIAKPSFGNILLWKVVYEYEGKFYVDAVRAGNVISTYSGESIDKLVLSRGFPWLNKSSQQAKDIERFREFSDGFLARDPDDASRIIDVRYSMVPNQIKPLWGIELSAEASADSHAKYVTLRDNNAGSRKIYSDMLLGH